MLLLNCQKPSKSSLSSILLLFFFFKLKLFCHIMRYQLFSAVYIVYEPDFWGQKTNHGNKSKTLINCIWYFHKQHTVLLITIYNFNDLALIVSRSQYFPEPASYLQFVTEDMKSNTSAQRSQLSSYEVAVTAFYSQKWHFRCFQNKVSALRLLKVPENWVSLMQ